MPDAPHAILLIDTMNENVHMLVKPRRIYVYTYVCVYVYVIIHVKMQIRIYACMIVFVNVVNTSVQSKQMATT